MNDGVFIAFLFDVGKNSATFGFGGSQCDRMHAPRIDIRTPSRVKWEALNYMLYEFDRNAMEVNSWQKLYQWLGHQLPGQGWACFTQESANEFLPHWFSENSEYRCRQLSTGGPFMDIALIGHENLNPDSIAEMLGTPSSDAEAQHTLAQFDDNFIITRRPIFVLD